jgi:hypothetical protein
MAFEIQCREQGGTARFLSEPWNDDWVWDTLFQLLLTRGKLHRHHTGTEGPEPIANIDDER